MTRHAGGLAAVPVDDDAIALAMEAGRALRGLLGWKREPPPEVAAAVARSKAQVEWDGQWQGKEWVADSTTVNIGVIEGGVQSNTIAAHCRMAVDLRPPIGVTTRDLQGKVEEVLASLGPAREQIDLRWNLCLEAAYAQPQEEIVQLVAANARQITGADIEINTSFGSTDARFWWQRGIPTAVYGTGLGNIALPDEYILEPQFGQVLKIHAATCIDYLCV